MGQSVWIFGYGSLVWRPAFPHAERRPAYVEGWKRRFWQGSIDHRGVPGSPGRVVTLLPEGRARCAGMAYRIEARDRETVLDGLDVRERGGYAQHVTPLHHADGRLLCAEGLLYVATPENPNYLGPAPLDEIAAQVRGAAGPSGPNLEYVLRLAEALREMDADDPHVFALEARLRDTI